MNGAASNPTVVSIPSPTNKDLHAVTFAGLGANRIVFAVGDAGTVLAWHF
jgi:hypothetical protein